jgi:hypothetical protein
MHLTTQVPVLATLIEFDGAVLYQNDGSLRYFGDLTVPGAAHSLYSRHVIAGNKAMGLSRDKKGTRKCRHHRQAMMQATCKRVHSVSGTTLHNTCY